MARTKFVFDPDFDENVYHASYKSRSSLRGLYDKVRAITDEIAEYAKSNILTVMVGAEAEATASRGDRFGDKKDGFQTAKARSSTLRTAYNSIFPIMGVDKEIFGRVIINRTGSTALEYGGIDVKGEIGRGTGKYIVHPVYGFLRQAMRKSSS